MNLQKTFPLIIAIACGLLGIILLNVYVGQQEEFLKKQMVNVLEQKQAELESNLITTKGSGLVIVSRRDIEPNKPITSFDISIVQMPLHSINPEAITSLEKILGFVTYEPLPQGKQILSKNLKKYKPKKDISALAETIPEGKTVIPVIIENFDSIISLIEPGSEVDVFATIPKLDRIELPADIEISKYGPTTISLFQKITIFTIGEELNINKNDSSQKSRETVSLILDYNQTMFLSFVQSQDGIITLALRASGDNAEYIKSVNWSTLMKYLNKKTPRTIEIYRGAEKVIFPLSKEGNNDEIF